MDAELITKVCAKCGSEKPRSEYRKREKGKNGFRNTCKQCENLMGREYRNQNKEKILLQRKKYREKNKEKILASKKIFRQKNRDRISIQRKIYRTKNKEKISAYMKIYRHKNKKKISKRMSEWGKLNSTRLNEQRKILLKNIPDWYIKYLINTSEKNITSECIPQSLINLKREEIKIKRLIKEMTQ